MIPSPRRIAILTIVLGTVLGLLVYTTGGTVCLAHHSTCTPATESVLRTFFLPIVIVAGYVLYRAENRF